MSNRQKKRNPHAYSYVDKRPATKHRNNLQRYEQDNDNYVILQRDPCEIVMGLCAIAFMAILFFLA